MPGDIDEEIKAKRSISVNLPNVKRKKIAEDSLAHIKIRSCPGMLTSLEQE